MTPPVVWGSIARTVPPKSPNEAPGSAAVESTTAGSTALVIGHPGHELRVHRWLELAQPVVFVLTDGSGRTGRSRIASTSAVLERVGARPASIYGRLSDQELYRAILGSQLDLFTDLADELARELDRAGVDCVVGDAVEGYNPGHDVCRLLLNTALLRLEAAGSQRRRNFDFPLAGSPDACPAELRRTALWLELDEAALERKLSAARAYPELAGEVAEAIARHGRDLFRIECLRPVRYGLDVGALFAHPPYYERHGEQQVAAGAYREVIRFRDHLGPLAEALDRHAARGGVAA